MDDPPAFQHTRVLTPILPRLRRYVRKDKRDSDDRDFSAGGSPWLLLWNPGTWWHVGSAGAFEGRNTRQPHDTSRHLEDSV
jgi:hypothetical protein